MKRKDDRLAQIQIEQREMEAKKAQEEAENVIITLNSFDIILTLYFGCISSSHS